MARIPSPAEFSVVALRVVHGPRRVQSRHVQHVRPVEVAPPLAQTVLEPNVTFRPSDIVVYRRRSVSKRLYLSLDRLASKAPFRGNWENVVQALLSGAVLARARAVRTSFIQVYALLKMLDLGWLRSRQMVDCFPTCVVGVRPGRRECVHVREIACLVISPR